MIVWDEPNPKKISKQNETSEQAVLLFQPRREVPNSVRPAEGWLPKARGLETLSADDRWLDKYPLSLHLTSTLLVAIETTILQIRKPGFKVTRPVSAAVEGRPHFLALS